MTAAVDVPRHTTRPEMLFPVTTASAAAGVTIGSVNEARVIGADVSNLALDLAVTDTVTMTYAELRVAAYKYPRRVWLVDSLPTGPIGELLRRDAVPPP